MFFFRVSQCFNHHSSLCRPEPQQICAACREEQFDEVRYRTLNATDPSTMDVDAQPESDALQEHAKIGKLQKI